MQISIAAPLTPLHTASSAAFGTFTTFQDVSPSPPLLIPAQAMNAGLDIFLEAYGNFSTTVTPTLSLGFWWASAATVIAQSSAITTASGAAAFPWHMEWRGRLRLTGTAGSIMGQGNLSLGTALTTFANEVPIPITAALRTVTVDTTAARAVGVGAAYGTSSASNTVTTDYFSCLLLS